MNEKPENYQAQSQLDHKTESNNLIERLDLVTEIAKAIRAYDPCGLTFEKEWVFCDDKRLDGIMDGYGKPMRQEICHCKDTAQLVYDTVVKPEISRLSGVIEEVKAHCTDAIEEGFQPFYRSACHVILDIINKGEK